MTGRIQNIEVVYADEARTAVNRVVIQFGDDHELEVVGTDGKACVHLRTKAAEIALPADGPLCPFERAINLLQLHLHLH